MTQTPTYDLAMAADVREGLTRTPKELAPKYFYDARGSELFDQITSLPEYYPSRCEREILNRHAPELTRGFEELVELGSGVASKTRALLYAMAGADSLRRYVPFDVDESVITACADELEEAYPGLEVHGVVGDFESDLGLIPPGELRLFALLGGTIGNLHPPERGAFLARVRELMGPTDRFLIGTDLVKERSVMVAAYDDSQGVTADFNRNLLMVLNQSLGADFEPEAFEHLARFDEDNSWIEMRLRSLAHQRVRVPGAQIEVDFAEGEEMRTEISTKFTPDAVEREMSQAGLVLDELLTDDERMYGLAVASCAPD